MRSRYSRSRAIRLRARPPGPAAQQWVSRDRAVISDSYTRVYPLVVNRARGTRVYDPDGNRYLDFTAGVGTNPVGHAHPKVVRAVAAQARKFIHLSGTDFYYPAQVMLAERLAAIAPGPGPKKTFFSNSGAEAVEAAVKLARYHTGRSHLIAFHGAFHGRTMGALSLTASKVVQRRGFSPLVPGVVHVPYAYCYRCPYHLKYPQCRMACVDAIEEQVFRRLVPPEEVAAIVVEPIQGEGGYVVPPPEFHPRLQAIAKSHGFLYIADEVQTGFGRTGRLFASEHFGVDPDILVLAKGIASGMPLGATIASRAIMTWGPGSHASTFGGHPISCEAARATLDLLTPDLLDHVSRIGSWLIEQLTLLQKTHRLIGDVRGKGLMVGVELVRDRETKEPAVSERNQAVQRCFEKGLLLLGCGESVIRFLPPLVVTRSEAETALSIFDEVLSEVEKRPHKS